MTKNSVFKAAPEGEAPTKKLEGIGGWLGLLALVTMLTACNSNDHYLVSCNDYTDAGVFWKLVSVTENSDGNFSACAWYAPATGETRQRACNETGC